MLLLLLIFVLLVPFIDAIAVVVDANAVVCIAHAIEAADILCVVAATALFCSSYWR